MTKSLRLIVCVAIAFCSVGAQASVWQPSPGHTQVPIWPTAVSDALSGVEPETTKQHPPIAGKPWTEVGSVTKPAITVYSPKGKNTGAAIVVFPGGGYRILAIDLEGTEVCDWLISRGITCVLLKYRVPGMKGYQQTNYPKSGPYPETPIALEDAQRAVSLVRYNAAKWDIDPNKIGVLGFSAGGHLVAAMSNHFQKRLYPIVDDADKVSCRPDFAIALYPGHLSMQGAESDAKKSVKKFDIHPKGQPIDTDRHALNPDLHPTKQTPPTFLLQAEDDHVDNVDDSLAYYLALKQAGVSVEMHLYATGGHAFGLRPTAQPITKWPQLVEVWLAANKMI
jgi:acetyl esterase/lipase